jgi:peroxiredoxin
MKKLLLCMVAAAAVAGAEEFKLGSAIHDFEVTGAKGEQVSYSALKGDTTVVIFVSTACPISNSYNDRMKAVYNEYAAKGVHFVFVNANNNEPAAEVAEHAKAHGFPFMVYKDATGAVANLFGAQVTPETFVMDKDGVIRYHGYVDDSANEARVRNQGLRLALDAVLAGKAVPVAQTKAFGCTIKRRRREL